MRIAPPPMYPCRPDGPPLGWDFDELPQAAILAGVGGRRSLTGPPFKVSRDGHVHLLLLFDGLPQAIFYTRLAVKEASPFPTSTLKKRGVCLDVNIHLQQRLQGADELPCVFGCSIYKECTRTKCVLLLMSCRCSARVSKVA